jgi:hypothetical protein
LGLGIAGALGSIYWEFSGVVHQFAPHNQSPRTAASGDGTLLPKAVVIGGPDFDFGSGQRESKLSHEFQIKNEGPGSLKLEKGATSCKCTLSEITDNQLPPGGIAKVKLDITLKTTGTKFRQTAEIHTNDPSLPTIVLSIQGNVRDVARLEPAELVLSNLTSSEGGGGSFRLYGFRDDTLQVTGHEFSNPDLAKYFEVELRPLTKEEVQAEADVRCGFAGSVHVKPGLPLGPVSQTIHFTTNADGAKTLDLSLSGSVLSDISIVGSHQFDDERNIVKFGPVKRSEGAQTTLRVLIKGPHRRDVRLSVKEIDPEGVLAATLAEPTELNNGAVFMYPLTVEVRRNARAVERLGSTKEKFGKIVLDSTHPNTKTINIYVRFVVE